MTTDRPDTHATELGPASAIARMESKLQGISRDAAPIDWARHAHNLGEVRRQRGNADDIEAAIGIFQSVLEIFSATEHPVDRALALNSLGACYLVRQIGEREENLERAIHSLEGALELRPRELFPDYWAKTLVNLSGAWFSRIRGDRARNLDAASQSMRAVLEEPIPAWVSQVRSQLLHQAVATEQQLVEVLESAGAPDVDELIAHNSLARDYFAALGEKTRAAICDFKIGDAWRRRRDVTEEVALTQAVARFRRSLEGLTDPGVTHLRAIVLIAVSDELVTLGVRNRDDRLGEAIAGYEEALSLMPEGDAQAIRVRTELGIALYEWSGGDRTRNIERAIEQHQRVLASMSRERDGVRWALAHHHLGNAYQSRRLGELAQNIEDALAHFELALEVLTRDEHAMDWAMVQNSLGITHQMRLHRDAATNQENAIEHLEKALEVFTREAAPEDWAMSMHNLGSAYMRRIGGDADENIERAIQAFEGSLEFRTRAALPYFWAMTQMNLGNAFRERRAEGEEINRRNAVRHYRHALEVFTRESNPDDWAWGHFSLGQLGTGSGLTSEERLRHLEAALEVYDRDSNPERWALAQLAWGLIELEGQQRQAAIDRFTRALGEITPEESPAACRAVRSHLADQLMAAGEWAAAAAVFEQMIAAGRTQLAQAHSEAGRLAASSSTDRIHIGAAYCLARLGETERSLLMLDAGRSRHLAESLARDNADLGRLPAELRQRIVKARAQLRVIEATERLRHEDLPKPQADLSRLRQMFPAAPQSREGNLRMVGLTIEQARIAFGAHGIRFEPKASVREAARAELESATDAARTFDPAFARAEVTVNEVLELIPRNGALVAFVVSSAGSLAFVIPAPASRIDSSHVVELGERVFARHVELLNGDTTSPGWLRAYYDSSKDESPAAWRDTIERTTHELWSLLLEPVQIRLHSLGLDQAPILLMPSAALALLPLQAASRMSDGKRRAFLDDHPITIAPSLYAASAARRRGNASHRDAPSLLAIVDPTDDLPYAELEGRLAADRFGAGAARVLSGEMATAEAVIEALPGKTHVHFAAHGRYDWRDVMRSWLALADDSRLTTGRIVSTDVDLGGVQLVVLSACETGLRDVRRAPDEFLGMPSAFIEGGARGVICALWSIDDLSTALLFGEFYRRHLGLGEDVAAALQGAQRWLRDGTARDLKLAEHWEKRAFAADPPDANAYAMARYYRRQPDVVPYSAPYYWAGFAFNG